MSGFFTDKDKNLFQFAGGDNSTKYCLPVGTIFPSAIPLTDASVHLLDGTTISQTGVYQEFAMLLKSLVSAGYNISCSQTDFDSAVVSTGNCGKFVIDDTANTIRLPKITRFIQGLSNMTNIGDSVEAGVPNITGTAYTVGAGSVGLYSGSSNGVFKAQATVSGQLQNTSGGTTYKELTFDASRSSAVYGNSSTVQPQATSFPYYIVLASGFVSDVKLDIDNIMTEINSKTSKDEINTNMLGVPSNRYINISGTTYTAPANGYIQVRGQVKSGQSYGFIDLFNDTNNMCARSVGVAGGQGIRLLLPVKTGDNITITYSASELSTGYLRFYYAEEL